MKLHCSITEQTKMYAEKNIYYKKGYAKNINKSSTTNCPSFATQRLQYSFSDSAKVIVAYDTKCNLLCSQPSPTPRSLPQFLPLEPYQQVPHIQDVLHLYQVQDLLSPE